LRTSARDIVALVLLGGAGTRLWPLSTEARPKQFLRLFDQKSLFQKTVERVRLAGVERLVLMTNEALVAPMMRDLADFAGLRFDVLLEPSRRDSAAAIAAGVAFVRERYGADTVVAVLPSDHLIPDDGRFADDLAQAAALARSGSIMTFGIPPTYPATAFGYIERGDALAGNERAFAVKRFHEKPAEAVAASYLDAGGFDWNSGMFVFDAETFAQESSQHMPDIWEPACKAVAKRAAVGSSFLLDADAFVAARKTSIDFALMEKSKHVGVLPASFQWSDVGTWSAVYDALEKDENLNVCLGDATVADCAGSLIIGEGAPALAMGLLDAILIVTRDGTFTAPRSRAADMKQLLDARAK
jgi:mannose-1-phosphate guanylyltransferase/mannose-6-phosphate isomerase